MWGRGPANAGAAINRAPKTFAVCLAAARAPARPPRSCRRQPGCDRTASLQRAFEGSGEEGIQGEAVAGGHQVDRVAHQTETHRAAFADQVGQLAGLESFEPRPESNIW